MARSLFLSERGSPAERRGRTDRARARFVAAVPDLLGVAAVIGLASVTIIGPLGVVLFVGCTAALIAWRPLFNINQLLRFSPLLLLPILAMISTVWSDAPQRTMRAALQLLLTIVTTIVVCRNLKLERFVLALFAGFLVVVLTVVPSVPSSFAHKYALTAWWGSKNSVGFSGQMLMALSLAVVADRRQFWPVRLLAVGGATLGLLVTYLAQSGGTAASLLITLLVFPPLAVLGSLKLPTRLTLIAFTLVILLMASFFLNDIDQAIAAFRSGVLNKDATLTGRTYLWEFAARLAGNRPMLGGGYYAFWRSGNIDAEGLWRWGGVAHGGGFNFHNAFVEMRVDLGWTGVAVLVATCGVVLVAALARQVLVPRTALAALIGITVTNYFRSYVETGLVEPFSLITLTWLATVLYAVPARARGAAAAPRRRFAERRPDLPRSERWQPAGARRWS